jgi:hypothetical protein
MGTRFRLGDIVVTPVSHHYAIGRIKADGLSQEPLGSERDRGRAVAIACKLAGPAARVFMWTTISEEGLVRVDCRKTPGD